MKTSILPLVTALCLFPAGFVHSQTAPPCRVMVPALEGSYDGACRDGLAQGNGTATGTDRYEGSFRKGLPHGKGTYTWSSGDVYEGQWNNGRREGEGSFRGRVNGRDTVLTGQWKGDRYMGSKPLMPKIILKYNVSDASFYRSGDGNKISVQFIQNGMPNNVEGLEIVTSSGTETQAGRISMYYDLQFPFHCKINYRSWNSLRTVLYNCTLEFEITQPGSWELKVGN
jgi:hypothetical protein